ncbi:hypothetical protein IFR05_017140 [Cadophora sp. M221]|nr:hypothetical protein IFR05_017140 [Cadophora sp. M221]
MISTSKKDDDDNSAGGGRRTSLSQDGTSIGEINGLRYAELMHTLQKIARLQRGAACAQVNARQKRREAAFKREEVWTQDAKFMGEIQRLWAEGKLAGLGELPKLAAQCQSARDSLGPLEQEETEAEQYWEGQIYTLRQAEEQLCNEFSREFSVASAYPPAPSNDDSNKYSSLFERSSEEDEITLDLGQRIIPHRTAGSVASTSSFPLLEETPARGIERRAPEIVLPGLEGITAEIGSGQCSGGSDSVFGDINDLLDGLRETDMPGPPQPLSKRSYLSVELYPHLLTNFTSTRDRVNKWLEGNILESHLEATLLYGIVKTRLAAEDRSVPSNWSQLVIAYWELDGAANLRFRNGDQPSTNSNRAV